MERNCLVEIYFDGSCRNVKGEEMPMGVGVCAFVGDRQIYSKAFYKGLGTSNRAEWHGCIEALKFARRLLKNYDDVNVKIYSDSQIIAYQFNGIYMVKKGGLRPLYEEAMKIYNTLPVQFKIEWINRKLNKVADKLSKEGHLLNVVDK